MNDLDRTDPLIDALAGLADPLVVEAPPLDAVLRRAAARRTSRRNGPARWAAAAALVLIAGSVAVIAGRGDDEGGVRVRSVEPDTFDRAPLPDRTATDPIEIGRRRFAGHDVTVDVETPTATSGGEPDYRAGQFGPFGPDRRFHRPDRCLPAGPPDARYTVSLASSGKLVEVNSASRPLPAVLDLTPFQVVGLDPTAADWSYRAVLVFTDMGPLTYTATFADGSTDRVTSEDPVVPMFGGRVPGPNAPTPGDIEPGLTTVVATDADGNEVWTVTSVDPYPWITAADCNGVDPGSIGVAAPEDVATSVEAVVGALPRVDAVPVSTLVDDAPPAFVGSVEELRRTYLADPGLRVSAEAVRTTADGETWAFLESTSTYLDRAWVHLVPTPAGWRMTRQSVCALVPGSVAVDGCADVASVFDPSDPA